MSKRNSFRLMEYVWIALAIITLAIAINELIHSGLSNYFYTFLIFSLLSFLMYFFRKKVRQNDEQD